MYEISVTTKTKIVFEIFVKNFTENSVKSFIRFSIEYILLNKKGKGFENIYPIVW